MRLCAVGSLADLEVDACDVATGVVEPVLLN